MKFLDIIKEEEVNVPDDVRKFAMRILAHFIILDEKEQSDCIIDTDINLEADSFFSLTSSPYENDYENVLEYHFDSEVESRSVYSSGTYNDPPDFEPAQIEMWITNLTIYKDGAEIYDGPDFTNFMKLDIGNAKQYRYADKDMVNKRTGEDFIWENFSDTLGEQEQEQQDGRW